MPDEENNDLARQSLQLLSAFKNIANPDLRDFIVQTVVVLHQSPEYAWPPFKEALRKLLCEAE